MNLRHPKHRTCDATWWPSAKSKNGDNLTKWAFRGAEPQEKKDLGPGTARGYLGAARANAKAGAGGFTALIFCRLNLQLNPLTISLPTTGSPWIGRKSNVKLWYLEGQLCGCISSGWQIHLAIPILTGKMSNCVKLYDCVCITIAAIVGVQVQIFCCLLNHHLCSWENRLVKVR